MKQKKTADELAQMTPAQLDALPYGVIELAPDGRILNYNAGESRLSGRRPEKVIGKNFFTEVAPCTAVRDFHGRFLDLIEHRAVNHEFDFLFTFDPPVTVRITMLYEQSENTVWLMVERR
jgi:two-component system, chemotaxis family, sensor kinase Cph1